MNINYEFETISAIATPLGFGGVGIVRLSGDEAFDIAQKIFSKNIDIILIFLTLQLRKLASFFSIYSDILAEISLWHYI